jgi:hypothetical protein
MGASWAIGHPVLNRPAHAPAGDHRVMCGSIIAERKAPCRPVGVPAGRGRNGKGYETRRLQV